MSLVVCCLLVSTVFLGAAATTDEDIQALTKNLLVPLKAVNPSQKFIDDTNSLAEALQVASIQGLPGVQAGSWADIDYKGLSNVNPGFFKHLENCQTIASLICHDNCAIQQGHPYYITLQQALEHALNYWFITPSCGSWWYTVLAVPQAIANISLLYLPPNCRDNVLTLLEMADVKGLTGANQINMLTIQVFRGVLTNNATIINESLAQVWDLLNGTLNCGGHKTTTTSTTPTILTTTSTPSTTTTVSTFYFCPVILPGPTTAPDGIQRDMSYLFQDNELASGSYGAVFTKNMLQIINYTFNVKSFQITDDDMKLFIDFLLDGERWSIINNVFDWSAFGRGCAIPQPYGAIVPYDIELQAFVPPPYRNDELEPFRRRVAGNHSQDDISGNRNFGCADYTVHSRPKWKSSVHMYSIRTTPSQCINGQGKLSEHFGDAVNFLYYTGDEYRDIFPIWNWQQLPGTTTEQVTDFQLVDCVPRDVRFPVPGQGTKHVFVGGISDGTYGASGMQLTSRNLSVNKAYFYFDDAYASISSDLVCNSTNQVLTTVANQVLSTDVTFSSGQTTQTLNLHTAFPAKTLEAVSWIHHGNTGYVFLDKPHVELELNVSASGNWLTCGSKNETVTCSTFRASIIHATTSSPATSLPATLSPATYIVLPNIDLSEMPKLLLSSPKDLVTSSVPEVSAVLDQGKNVLQAVFWKAGPVSFGSGWTITALEPCMLLIQIENGLMNVTATSPYKPNLILTITIDRSVASNQYCQTTSGITKITLELPGIIGTSTTVTCVLVGLQVEASQGANGFWVGIGCVVIAIVGAIIYKVRQPGSTNKIEKAH